MEGRPRANPLALLAQLLLDLAQAHHGLELVQLAAPRGAGEALEVLAGLAERARLVGVAGAAQARAESAHLAQVGLVEDGLGAGVCPVDALQGRRQRDQQRQQRGQPEDPRRPRGQLEGHRSRGALLGVSGQRRFDLALHRRRPGVAGVELEGRREQRPATRPVLEHRGRRPRGVAAAQAEERAGQATQADRQEEGRHAEGHEGLDGEQAQQGAGQGQSRAPRGSPHRAAEHARQIEAALDALQDDLEAQGHLPPGLPTACPSRTQRARGEVPSAGRYQGPLRSSLAIQ